MFKYILPVSCCFWKAIFESSLSSLSLYICKYTKYSNIKTHNISFNVLDLLNNYLNYFKIIGKWAR